MALFENFPYTNLHELNLDWLINVLNELKEGQVLSVNGQTGAVILYQDPDVVFPSVDRDYWSIVRMADGTSRGIMFGNDDKAYIVHGTLMAQLYGQNNPPPYPVSSVNGQTGDIILYTDQYVRLPALSDADMHNWNIFRQLNGVSMGIQFEDDGSAYIINGSNRYRIYTANDEPDYPVDSVNGQTGAVSLFTDTGGSVIFPAITDPNVTGWILGRYINNTSVYIRLDTDGRMALYAGNNVFRVYTTEDTEQDIINIPSLAATSNWGLIRTTASGSVGIMFNNAPGLTEPSAYVRYVDSNSQVHTVKLLTQADIPSSTGVISVNGLDGIVTLTGEDIAVSTLNNTPISQAITTLTLDLGDLETEVSDLSDDMDDITQDITDLNTLTADIKDSIAYVEDTNTATNNIPAGSAVLWKNEAYIAATNIAIGDTLSSTNLTAVSTGFINTLINQIKTNTYNPTFSNATPSGTAGTTNVISKFGNVIHVFLDFTMTNNVNAWTTFITTPIPVSIPNFEKNCGIGIATTDAQTNIQITEYLRALVENGTLCFRSSINLIAGSRYRTEVTLILP